MISNIDRLQRTCSCNSCHGQGNLDDDDQLTMIAAMMIMTVTASTPLFDFLFCILLGFKKHVSIHIL